MLAVNVKRAIKDEFGHAPEPRKLFIGHCIKTNAFQGIAGEIFCRFWAGQMDP
jgi:hypothetical protein